MDKNKANQRLIRITKRNISTNTWTKWTDITEVQSKKETFNYLGIYQIRIATKKGEPISIGRLARVDKSGILYIGRSGFHNKRSLSVRINEFVKKYHSGGITYSKAEPILDLLPRFLKRHLQVRAKIITDRKYIIKEKIIAAESEALKKYFEQFAELPPCNSSNVKYGK